MALRNIVIVQDFAYINGGNAKVSLTSAIALKRKGYRVILFSGTGPVMPDIIDSGIETICLGQTDISHSNKFTGCIRGIWNIKAERAMNDLLCSLSPDETIVHLHGWNKVLSPSIWQPLYKKKFKVVITIHDFYLFCPNLGLFNYKTLSICDKCPSSIFCYICNCDSRSYLQKLWRDIRQIVQWQQIKRYGKFNVITIGRTNESISKKSLSKYVRKWYQIQNPIDIGNKTVVDIENNDKYLFIARLSAEKGIALFSQCIADLQLKGCVLGDGYLLQEYKRKYPNIEFAGWVSGEEKEQYIKQAKALIFPSLWYEGAPLTPIEMKSYGIPCIVPDRCAASEVVEDGVDGFIFKSGDLRSLEETVLKYENADLKAMQTRLLANFNPQLYSMDEHTNKLIESYSDILQQRNL